MKKAYGVIIFLILIVSVIWFLSNRHISSDTENEIEPAPGKFTNNDDGTVTLGLGLTSHGLHDSDTNNVIDSDSLLYPVNGLISERIGFQQNLEEKQSYVLLLLVDYKVREFSVNGISYEKYPFSLDPKDEVSIDFELQGIKEDDYELTYLILDESNDEIIKEKSLYRV